MEKIENTERISDTNIDVTLPVKIGYSVIDELLRSKMIGEIISKEDSNGEKSNYAQILDVSIEKSQLEAYDFLLNINLQTLTSLFKNKQVKILFHASLDLDKGQQRVSLKDYLIDGKTKNWIADQLLETVLNKWMYGKFKKKMNFDFMPHIEKHIKSLNEKLENKLEAKEGIHLIGSLENLELSNLKAGDADLWISVTTKGTGIIELTKLDF
ncbi:DUF4403 family protein [Christiangramia forsetii]|uniref:DUF4403 family protein n=2 Tax=Christiangramia forsetii TaxID=411153 RepID=A0M5Q2_CHRFK|nr:DUF4403 family protein [Christiangramia forsetii]GGG32447.1 hypothetical protein GCM10011532_14970 [Christiangramia forsetii]CAL67947.1 hypothetical protein GFO_3001 [Christiangramia forsetii KT0803]